MRNLCFPKENQDTIKSGGTYHEKIEFTFGTVPVVAGAFGILWHNE